MRVLVVQGNADLGAIWCRFLTREGIEADLASTQEEALRHIATEDYDALVIDPVLSADEGGLPVADFATFRNPDILVIAVTTSTFFSGGSIFEMMPTARGILRTPLRPGDLLAYLQHFDPERRAAVGGGHGSALAHAAED